MGGDKDAFVDFIRLGHIKTEEELQEYISKLTPALVKMSR